MTSREVLDKKQLAKLLMIISEPNITIKETYLSFKKEYKNLIMRACASLSLLLSINLLNQKQRILSLAILIQAYGQDFNPFFGILDNILQETKEEYEKKIIGDLILGVEIEDWERKTPNEIVKEMKEFSEEFAIPSGIEAIRAKFRQKTAELLDNGEPLNKIGRIIPDYQLDDEDKMIPKDTLKLQDLDPADLQIKDYDLELLSLMPNEIPLREEEFKWAIPLVQDELMWVQENDQQVIYENLKGMILLASTENLGSGQIKFILDLSARNLDFLCGENPEGSGQDYYFLQCINGIVDKNTSLMISLLIMLSNEKKDFFKKVLTKYLASVDQTIHSLEVIYNILQLVELPQNFFNAYIFDWFKCCENVTNDVKKKSRNLKLVTKFVTHLLEKDYFDPSECYDVWVRFCASFNDHKCAKSLGKLLEKACTSKEKN